LLDIENPKKSKYRLPLLYSILVWPLPVVDTAYDCQLAMLQNLIFFSAIITSLSRYYCPLSQYSIQYNEKKKIIIIKEKVEQVMATS
jgi:hypothetical protein